MNDNFIDEWTEKLNKAILAEIDQEVLIESGLMNASQAIHYRQQFAKEFRKAINVY